MENIWRFYNGVVSGIVIAENEEEAKERANQYLLLHFDDIPNVSDMQVWKLVNDDGFEPSHPYAIAVAY